MKTIEVSTSTLTGLARKLVNRLNGLGIKSAAGNPLVIDQGAEGIAALMGYRNRHVMHAALTQGVPSSTQRESEENPVVAGLAGSELHCPRMVVLGYNSAGELEFFRCSPQVTAQQLHDGEQYDLAKECAQRSGYEPPFIAFGADDVAAQQMKSLGDWLTAPARDAQRQVSEQQRQLDRQAADDAFAAYDFRGQFGDSMAVVDTGGWETSTGDPTWACTVYLADEEDPEKDSVRVRFHVEVVAGVAQEPDAFI